MAGLSLENVSKAYSTGSGLGVTALEDISLEVERGEYLAVTGASVSGKSTLLKIIGLQLPPTSGTYSVDGLSTQDLSETERTKLRARQIGYVFQNYRLLPSLNVGENVQLGLEIAGRSIDRSETLDQVTSVLGKVGLKDYLNRYPRELSGGQQQRVAIARAIVKQPELVLADEPTGNLDSETGEAVLEVFDTIYRDGQTLIVVTHDPKVSERAARTTQLRDGRIVSDFCRCPKCSVEDN